MPRYIYDPQYLRFITDIINKTDEKRLQWFANNKEKLMESVLIPEQGSHNIDTTDVMKIELHMCLPGLPKDH